MSVAEGDPMRSPNPREGIHGAPRIARITRILAEKVCGDAMGGAMWLVAVHRRFLRGESKKNVNDYFINAGKTFKVRTTGSHSLIRKSVIR